MRYSCDIFKFYLLINLICWSNVWYNQFYKANLYLYWSRRLPWPLFSLTFFYVFCFSPTSGILRKLKLSLPSYFGITRRNIKKIVFFFKFKTFFPCNFSAFYDQFSVVEPGPTPSPWNIITSFIRQK